MNVGSIFIKEKHIYQERSCTYKCDIKWISRNNSCCERAKSNTYSECMSVVLVIQRAMRLRRVI